MKVLIILSVSLSLFSVACTTHVAQQDLGSAQARALKMERAKNEFLSRRLVHLFLVDADTHSNSLAQITAFGSEEPVDVGEAVALRSQQRIVRTDLPGDSCNGTVRVSIKNATGENLLLLVDDEPVVYVGPTFLTNFVGAGAIAHLCLSAAGAHSLSGGTYTKLQGAQSPTRVFYMPLVLDADAVQVILTPGMLTHLPSERS